MVLRSRASRRATLASVSFLFASLVAASSAQAEAGRAPPRCEAFAVPRYSFVVPSNLPAIVTMPTAAAEGSYQATLTSFEAIEGGAAGTTFEDAFDRSPESRIPGATLFTPNATLPADTTFEATFAVDCGAIEMTTTARFVTAGPTELPTSIGTLTTRAGDGPQGIEVLVEPTPELLAFLPVTMFQIETRVGFAVFARYGEASLSDGGRIKVRTPPTFPLTLCEANDEGSSHVESMSLHAHVAGAASDPPPVPFDAVIACERPAPAGAAPAAGGGDAGDAGGCTMAKAESRSACATFALSLLAVVVARRRRALRASSVRGSSR